MYNAKKMNIYILLVKNKIIKHKINKIYKLSFCAL